MCKNPNSTGARFPRQGTSSAREQSESDRAGDRAGDREGRVGCVHGWGGDDETGGQARRGTCGGTIPGRGSGRT